jgi:hypothetical protein
MDMLRKTSTERDEIEQKQRETALENGHLREQELQLKAEVHRLEALRKLQEQRIIALSAIEPTPPITGKENM